MSKNFEYHLGAYTTIPNGTRSFDSQTLQIFSSQGQRTNICHRLSFGAMKNILAHCLTYKNIEGIKNLIDIILCPTKFKPYCNDSNTIKYIKTLYNKANVSFSKLNSEGNPSNNIDQLETILICLNNSPINLRLGDSSWNQSIQNGFDPVAYITDDENKRFIITDSFDCFILSCIFYKNGSLLPTDDPISIYTGKFNVNRKTKNVLYSSNNIFSFVSNKMVGPCDYDIYYHRFDFKQITITNEFCKFTSVRR